MHGRCACGEIGSGGTEQSRIGQKENITKHESCDTTRWAGRICCCFVHFLCCCTTIFSKICILFFIPCLSCSSTLETIALSRKEKKKTRLFPNRTGEKTAHAGFESWNLYHLSITQLLYAIWIDKPQSNLEVVQFFYFILADSLSLSLSLNVISPTMRHCVGIVNMDSMHIAALKESPALQLCQWRITGFWRTE